MFELNLSPKKVASDSFQIIQVKGEIDNTNVLTFMQRINDFLTSFNDKSLIFDFTYFDYGNSQFLGFMVDVSTRLSTIDKQLYVTNLQPQIFDMFDNMNLFQIIKYEEKLDDLISKLI